MKCLRKNLIFVLVFTMSLVQSSQGFAQSKHHKSKPKHKHSSSSSSQSHKNSCCERDAKLLEELKRTTNTDLLVDMNTNYLAQQINSNVLTDLAIDQNILSILETQTQCINYITSVPYTISAPGYYRLACDLVYSPTESATSAITIDANLADVNLDFANYSLRMVSLVPTADNMGILINSGCQNIAIHDGTIRGFSASQIKGLSGLRVVDIRNMQLFGAPLGSTLSTETVSAGVFIAGASSAICENVKFANVLVQGVLLNNLTTFDLAARGIFCEYTNDVQVYGCQGLQLQNFGAANSATTPPPTSVGAFVFQFCSNVIVRNSLANDNQALNPNDPVTGLVTGDCESFMFINSNSTEVYDCSASNNLGTRRAGAFLWLNGCTGFVCERCESQNNNVTNVLAAGVQSHYGFEMVTGGASSGFVSQGQIIDCHVNNQQRGFNVDGATDIIIQRCTCIAGGQLGTTATTNGIVVTSTLGIPSNGITIEDCIVSGFVGTSGAFLNGIGIVVFNTTPFDSNINIRRCKVIKNSYGIVLEGSVSGGPKPIVVDSNEVAFNTATGLVDQNTPQTHNLIIRNLAYANGTNYSVSTSNTSFSVVQASQSNPFPLYSNPNISPLSNFDLQP